MNLKFNLLTFILLISITLFGQFKEFKYTRKIINNEKTWQKIIIPNEVFGKVKKDLNDIRIYRINNNNDTIEVPYFIKENNKKNTFNSIEYKTINVSKNGQAFFYTFEIKNSVLVNEFYLNIIDENFNYLVDLEGSQDLKNWFTIIEQYRILSIKNQDVNYNYTNVKFPDSKYKYYRIKIKTKDKPNLKSVKIYREIINPKQFNNYKIKNIKKNIDKKNKKSIIEIELEHFLPISALKFRILDSIDYYRHVIVTDESVNNWSILSKFTMSSFEKNDFYFNSVFVNKIKLEIFNNDNLPLNIDSFEIMGNFYEIIANFKDDGNYFLAYGNSSIQHPEYDILYYKDKVPKDIKLLQLGSEVQVLVTKKTESLLFLKSKIWIWAIMILIIFTLSWFTLKLIKKNS